jgi:hypothetical protein
VPGPGPGYRDSDGGPSERRTRRRPGATVTVTSHGDGHHHDHRITRIMFRVRPGVPPGSLKSLTRIHRRLQWHRHVGPAGRAQIFGPGRDRPLSALRATAGVTGRADAVRIGNSYSEGDSDKHLETRRTSLWRGRAIRPKAGRRDPKEVFLTLLKSGDTFLSRTRRSLKSLYIYFTSHFCVHIFFRAKGAVADRFDSSRSIIIIVVLLEISDLMSSYVSLESASEPLCLTQQI